MFNAPRNMIAVAAAAAVLFAVGLTQLFFLRFEAGDVYPAYCSLRTDPLGTQALFESFNQVADNSARRNFRSPDQISLTPEITLLVCGLGADGFFLGSKAVSRLMDQLAASGGRLVLTFTSRVQHRKEEADDGQEQPCPKDADTTQKSDPIQEPVEESESEAEDEWLGRSSLGFDFRQTPVQKGDDDAALLIDPGLEGLPAMIPWRTTLSFELEDQAWQTLYTWQDQPVVVHRPWGRGTLVMAADSYLVSNEALRSHRFADLLAWLAGPDRAVVFDEFHHGLAYQPGIAALARQYRLHGVFGALLLVVSLFVWRQSAVFVPPVRCQEESDDMVPAAGRDTGEGLVDLTRRHIDDRQLLAVCFDAWYPLCGRRTPESLVAQVRALVQQAAADPKQHNPVNVYRRICELLKQGKKT